MKKIDMARKAVGFTLMAMLLGMGLSSCSKARDNGTDNNGGEALMKDGTMPVGEMREMDGNLPPMEGGIPGMQMQKGEIYSTKAAKVYEDVHYASVSDSEVCDIYLPESSEKTPVLILVHGGGFAFESNRMSLMESVAVKAIEKGYAVVAVDYRKSGEASFPGALSDVKAAVRFVKANADEYNLDETKIAIWGESAGDYLSLMTSLTSQVKELDGDVKDNEGYSSSVNVLVDFYGPVEFYTMDEEYNSLGVKDTTYSTDSSFESRFLGQAIGKDKDTTYRTYWESYVSSLPEDFSLKTWIQAGTSDKNVPYTQSSNFGKRLANVIGEENVHSSLIEGAAHMDKAFYTDENLEAVFAFIGF